jgi:hypothetical protein
MPSQFGFDLLKSIFNPVSQGVLQSNDQNDVARQVSHDKSTISFVWTVRTAFGDLVVPHLARSPKDDFTNVAPLRRVFC